MKLVRKSDWLDAIASLHTDAGLVRDRLAAAIARAETYMKGPSSGGQGTRGEAELTGPEAGAENPDKIRRDADEALKRLARSRDDLAWLVRFGRRYTEAIGLVDPEGEQGCSSCKRLPASHALRDATGKVRVGQPSRWEPVHRTPTDAVKGVPQKPLCRWCYDFALVYEQWPPLGVLEEHHDGKRVGEARIARAIEEENRRRA